jgi:Bacterial Ig-like domain (group 3)
MPELTMDDVLANTEAQSTEVGALETFAKGLKRLLDDALANEPISPAGTRRVDKLFTAIADQKDTIATALAPSTAPAKVGTVVTATALTSSLNPATVGTAVVFTAVVSQPTPSAAPVSLLPGPAPVAPASTTAPVKPTGTVKFMDGIESIGSGKIDSTGKATFSKTFPLAGTYSITAVYEGDAVNAGSTSPVVVQTVT